MLYNLIKKIKLDHFLFIMVIITMVIDLAILYSSSGNSIAVPLKQLTRFAIGITLMILIAQVKPQKIAKVAPYIYFICIFLLIFVYFKGHIGKGAQRWINLGFIKFEPSEIMKISLPIMLAATIHNNIIPISQRLILSCILIIIIPVAIIIKQPDLGTAILLVISGSCVIFLAGLSWRIITLIFTSIVISGPITWHFMHNYQKQRVFTFLNPESAPLTSGYHIIQSKIAIGSGGILGKGWLAGTQSHLNFLPENSTDFIFAHICEELGLIGGILVIILFIIITFRGYQIAFEAQDTFSRLSAAAISTNFFCYSFVNIGMTIGILPVVGVPLPLISYGGSFLVTTLVSFGILMSISCNKKLINS